MYDLLRDYVKQETLDPIRGAGRWMAWAALGAIALILGVTFLMVGLLRLVQTELFSANDGKTWVPYLIVVVVSFVLVLSSKARIRKPSLHRTRRNSL
jgi:membrane protein implicated in regulation of membrane protease activity